ncbi:MAG: hypothetical protein HY675_27515 [Chloroflexi bacterium]|nr:hypothetical protein [Chloroflexota bacterium]
MKVGLLWYDADTKKPGEVKVDEAAERYRNKFRVSPDTCHVHPGYQVKHRSIAVVPNPRIRPHYYWIGVEEEASDCVQLPA